ncbi:MAG TPA: TonB-dependent receptor plug domain-containing protein, partial [Leptospiraceae bacterium]|nr:TonB-dependent receptor plug domain-containing protein [Leptospiraceae bacterium]
MIRFFHFIIILYASAVYGQETVPKKAPPTAEEIEAEKKRMEKMYEKAAINVIGDNKDSLKKIPGSATLVEKKFLEETQPLDAMEVLRRVPGASTRFMDSAGLTPNIGFRGVSNEESRKTLILEDGVLTSLSPYGQPESYYSPQIDRMSRVEIVKGSGSILFGPSTIGGIVNFVTRKPPAKNTFSTRTMGGENGYFSSLNQFGGTTGKTGYDISYLHKQGDGYRDYNHFNVNEANLKLVHALNDRHTFTFKLSVHEQKARATYLGLTEGLYWKNQRINPAQFDLKELNRTSAVLGHEYTLNE